jgi:glucose/arabinose dehydrogenase
MQTRNLTLVAALFALVGCGGGEPETAASMHADTGGLALPDGFTATIFADGLGSPRHIAVNANGDVYVTLRNGQDQGSAGPGIVGLRDTDGDGKADQVEHFGPTDTDTGMAIHDGTLYFSSTTTIYALPLGDSLVPSGEPRIVVSGIPQSSGGHSSKPITFDNAGHLYTQAGVPSNACQEQPRTPKSPGLTPCPFLQEYGGVFRLSADARDQVLAEDGIRYSTGHRNVVALEWNPVADKLYLVMHGRDQLDQLWPESFTEDERVELPAEEFHQVDQGDNLGWPYTYYDPMRHQRMVGPEYGGDGETPAEPGKYKEPLIGFPAHWAPNDLVFYTGTQFPEKYRNGAFIAFHGSWNRQRARNGEQAGYAVVFVPMSATGEVTGDWEIFADDFEGPSPVAAPTDAAHRPSGVAVGPDGSLYVSDDTGGRIWKVSYQGT